jgi:phosphoribosylformylglycinamidine synthase
MTEITPEILKAHNLSQEEYDLIVKYIGRTPNINELGIFSAMWSEHCGYKNTRPLLKKLPTTGKYVIHGPGENAGVVDIGDGDALAFKIESHNHPSAVEPYQGAATGVGGILRDIFTMGARPIALLDSLRFGNPESARTKHLVDGVVRGIAGYGNCMGIPTVAGEVFFEETYNQNILVNAMCVGLSKKDKLVTSRASGLGNWLIYYGSTTGRDGVHGASFASAKLEEDEEMKSAVQVGDPFLEKLLMEATLELIEKDLVIAAQDMGAAGLTSASTEMASKGDQGVRLNLDAIPKRASDITAYEMLLSESQERMLALISPEKWDEVKKVLDKWGIYGSVVGEIIQGRNFEVYYQNEKVADLPLDTIIEDVPSYTREVLPEPKYFKKLKPVEIKEPVSIEEGFKKLLASPNIASKQWVFQQYDYMIGDSTIVPPGTAGGALVRIPGSNKGVALTTDCNSRYTYLNPEKGTMIAVAEAARNVAAMGATPLAVTNCLNFGTPTDLDVYYQLYHCMEGMKKACEALETPVTGGNASLYNEGSYGSIFPTPTIGMVGLLEDISKTVTPAFKQEGDIIYLIGETKEELDGTEFARLFTGELGKNCPDIDLEIEKRTLKLILTLTDKEIVASADDLSLGGLAIALSKACIQGHLGCSAEAFYETSKEAYLFGESQSRFLVSVSPDKEEALLHYLQKGKIRFKRLGEVLDDPKIEIDYNKEKAVLDVNELRQIYYSAFEKAIS